MFVDLVRVLDQLALHLVLGRGHSAHSSLGKDEVTDDVLNSLKVVGFKLVSKLFALLSVIKLRLNFDIMRKFAVLENLCERPVVVSTHCLQRKWGLFLFIRVRLNVQLSIFENDLSEATLPAAFLRGLGRRDVVSVVLLIYAFER